MSDQRRSDRSRRPRVRGHPEDSAALAGRRTPLYGAAEERSAVGSPADREACWVGLSCGLPVMEGRMGRAASRGRPEQGATKDQVPGRGCGLRGRQAHGRPEASQSRTPTYPLLPLSSSGTCRRCSPRLRAFPTPSRELVGVCVCEQKNPLPPLLKKSPKRPELATY